MTRLNGYEKFEQLVQRMDSESKLLRIWELKGGISAQVTGLEIEQADGQIVRRVVRQHGDRDLKRNPNIAADEFKLLEVLKNEGLLVPQPYYLDQSCEIFPKPIVMIEFIEGKAEFNPVNLNDYIFQVVTNLINIHRVDCSKLDVSFLPRQEDIVDKIFEESSANNNETLETLPAIRDTLKSVLPLPQRNKDVILHRDIWPGNLLWKDEKLVSVIDWEDVAIGDPLADLANGRLEVLYHFGIEAMNEFTKQYKSMMKTVDFTSLPYWDLWAALRLSKFPEWGLEESAEETMRERHKLFVTQAINLLDSY